MSDPVNQSLLLVLRETLDCEEGASLTARARQLVDDLAALRKQNEQLSLDQKECGVALREYVAECDRRGETIERLSRDISIAHRQIDYIRQKIQQTLAGQYPDGAALRAALAFIDTSESDYDRH